MKSFTVGLCGAAMFAASTLAAQTATTTDDKVTRVTMTGCVEKAKENGRYVFTNVTDKVEGGRTAPQPIYWVTDTDGLKAHIGHTVEVSGTIRPDKDRDRMGSIEAEVDGINNNSRLTVRDVSKKAHVDGVQDLPGGTPGTITKVTLSRPVMRLKPASLKMVDSTCHEAQRLAGNLPYTRPPLALAQAAPPAAAPVIAEREVAAVTPPPVTEPNPVGTSGFTPAPRTELPKTASPVSLYMLMAFGAIAAAGALRAFRARV